MTPAVTHESTHSGISYTVSDGTDSSTATVTIALNNSVPVANSDSYSASYGDNTLTVKNNDTDFNGDPLSVTITTPPTRGAASVSGGNVIYNIQSPASGSTDTFTYQISDGRGGTSSATVTVNLPNNAPVANSDSYTAASGPNSFAVLSNDSDPNGDPLAITSGATGSFGTATFDGTTLYYTPNSPASGSVETLAYWVSDGRGGSASAAITINLPNNAPVANSDSYSVNWGSNWLYVLNNDSDPNNDSLTLTIETAPGQGSAAASGSVVVYTLPTTPASGTTDTFTYKIDDSRGGTSTATVTINLPNNAPVANSDSYTATSGSNAFSVVANDNDPNGDPLSITSVSYGTFGTASFSGTTLYYTPNSPASGSVETLTYWISDGRGGSAAASVAINLPNDAPVANSDSYSVNSGSNWLYVLTNDSDPNNDSLTLTIETNPGQGTAAVSGSVVVYTPTTPASGTTDSFTYKIDDNRGDTSFATVTINLPNNAPVANSDSYTATSGSNAFSVVANDNDPNGDPLSITSVSYGTFGTASFSGTTLYYTPNSPASGSVETLTY